MTPEQLIQVYILIQEVQKKLGKQQQKSSKRTEKTAASQLETSASEQPPPQPKKEGETSAQECAPEVREPLVCHPCCLEGHVSHHKEPSKYKNIVW